MTGPGTNTYLVGGGTRNEWAVIDPGPLDSRHAQAVLAAAPGPIRWILATHTHTDHSPGCLELKERTGAIVSGRLPAHPEWQDASFAPEQRLGGGERLSLGDAATLRVIHTPGHASNHLCYLLEEEKTLFTGDHVMQLSTVVINPPDGDMAAYITSLRALLALDLQWLAPGHGFLMAQPRRAIEWIIGHRLKREAKVVDALRDLGPAAIEALLAQVYDDVPERMHGVATRSLKAHLYKLRDEALACESAGRWQLEARSAAP
jgi:glyoxylase-like metal-dependent hydrolase (beta-lactamase superfamily II)